MEISKSEDWTRVTLVEGDDLSAVPKKHRLLLSPQIRAWWSDPRGVLERAADGATGPHMAAWFRTMAERGESTLNLYKTTYDLDRAGFALAASGIYGAEVGPPSGDTDGLPPALAAFYGLVGYLDWAGFENAGGIEAVKSHTSLKSYAYLCEGSDLDPAAARIFGWGSSGDMLFYLKDGRAGKLSHETGELTYFTDASQALEWVFGELLANRCPQF